MADYFLSTRRARMGVTPRFRTPTIPQVTLPTTPTIPIAPLPRAEPITYPQATTIPRATAVTPTTPTTTPELSVSDILGLQKPGMFETIAGAIPEYEAPTPPSGWHPLAQMAYMGEAAPSGWETGLRALLGGLVTREKVGKQKKYWNLLEKIYQKGGFDITLNEEGNIVLKKLKSEAEILEDIRPDLIKTMYQEQMKQALKTPEEREAERYKTLLTKRQIGETGARTRRWIAQAKATEKGKEKPAMLSIKEAADILTGAAEDPLAYPPEIISTARKAMKYYATQMGPISEIGKPPIITPTALIPTPTPTISTKTLPPGITQEDLTFTAQKYGITEEEVLRKLGY